MFIPMRVYTPGIWMDKNEVGYAAQVVCGIFFISFLAVKTCRS